jgi:hypothetical protein
VKRPTSSPDSTKNTRSKHPSSNPSGGSPQQRKNHESNSGNEEGRVSRRGSAATQLGDLPPNRDLPKHADELYGDTEIPDRKEE